jgi:hypothetical protein
MTSFTRIETEYDAGQNLKSMRSYSLQLLHPKSVEA